MCFTERISDLAAWFFRLTQDVRHPVQFGKSMPMTDTLLQAKQLFWSLVSGKRELN